MDAALPSFDQSGRIDQPAPEDSASLTIPRTSKQDLGTFLPWSCFCMPSVDKEGVLHVEHIHPETRGQPLGRRGDLRGARAFTGHRGGGGLRSLAGDAMNRGCDGAATWGLLMLL